MGNGSERHETRPLGLLDALILIGGLAPDMAGLRSSISLVARHLSKIQWTTLASPLWDGTLFQSRSRSALGRFLFEVCFASLANLVFPRIALLLLRLRRPRPSDRVLVLQPGPLAYLAAPVGVALLVGFGNDLSPRPRTALFLSRPAGSLVAAWTLLLMARRFRPEHSWIDRLGRLLGATWILALIGLALIRRFLLY